MSSQAPEELRSDLSRPVVIVEPMTPVRAMQITLAVLFVLGLVWLAIQVAEIILILVFGILLAAAVDPIVDHLRRRGLSRGQSILVIYGVLFLAISGALLLIVPPLVTQAQVLIAGVPDYIAQARQFAATSNIPVISDLAQTRRTDVSGVVEDVLSDPPIEAAQVTQAIEFVTSFVGVIFTTVSVMIVAYYWMTERAIIKRLILGLFPLDQRDRAHGLWDDIEDKFGGWARGQVVLMLIIGVTSTIAYGLLGLPFWFLLGIWAGVTELIPFVGPFLGGGLALLVALGDSWQKALVVLGFVIVLQQLEGNVIVPRVMRNSVGLSPLTVILAVLVGSALLGILGAVLAIPVAAAVQVLVSELLRAREEEDDRSQRPILGGRARASESTDGGLAAPGRGVTLTATTEPRRGGWGGIGRWRR